MKWMKETKLHCLHCWWITDDSSSKENTWSFVTSETPQRGVTEKRSVGFGSCCQDARLENRPYKKPWRCESLHAMGCSSSKSRNIAFADSFLLLLFLLSCCQDKHVWLWLTINHRRVLCESLRTLKTKWITQNKKLFQVYLTTLLITIMVKLITFSHTAIINGYVATWLKRYQEANS